MMVKWGLEVMEEVMNSSGNGEMGSWSGSDGIDHTDGETMDSCRTPFTGQVSMYTNKCIYHTTITPYGHELSLSMQYDGMHGEPSHHLIIAFLQKQSE